MPWIRVGTRGYQENCEVSDYYHIAYLEHTLCTILNFKQLFGVNHYNNNYAILFFILPIAGSAIPTGSGPTPLAAPVPANEGKKLHHRYYNLQNWIGSGSEI